MLAKSGVLNNVNYTTPIVEWIQEHTKAFGGENPFARERIILERVVRDKNIITAQGNAFIDFAVEICDWFNLFENEVDKEDFIKSINGW